MTKKSKGHKKFWRMKI